MTIKAKAAAATIIQSGLCKTTAKFRPTPTMFSFPGLASKPFYDPKDFPWVQTLEHHFAAQCPKTADVLESIPGFMVGTPFSFAFFSTLHANSKIEAHCAPCNLRLRVHFPIIVPTSSTLGGNERPSCGIRVADELRHWEEGKTMIFDDAYEHEVWNEGREERVLLLFDLWHPELVPEERGAIEEMFGFARSQGWLK
eukprot:CAMPEP_0194579818 /NCGR_PEP_ID=MMETSP0292-20121207/13788_1 /TAXON_ID=39354 /ORGANISM="Heterosigma akashiwo, Strain CCMP2393" /LENGTH=196 /DNA_ID=CAMNT_0039432957 /DNA_START=112 /DNA_END=705 /DNA_ORIENTATION=+